MSFYTTVVRGIPPHVMKIIWRYIFSYMLKEKLTEVLNDLVPNNDGIGLIGEGPSLSAKWSEHNKLFFVYLKVFITSLHRSNQTFLTLSFAGNLCSDIRLESTSFPL